MMMIWLRISVIFINKGYWFVDTNKAAFLIGFHGVKIKKALVAENLFT